MAEKLNNVDLVAFARTKIGLPYLYGMKQKKGGSIVVTQAKYNELKKAYGSMVWDSDIKCVGKVATDCSGLISWYTGVTRGSSEYKTKATKVYDISTIKNAPIGALVWQQGHIGIYSGMKNGIAYYVAEDGSAYGCRENKLSNSKFTHWFLCVDIEYVSDTTTKTDTNTNTNTDTTTKKEVDDEVIDTTTLNVNGKNYTVNRILKENTNFVKLSDLKQAGFDVGYNSTTKVPSFGVSTTDKTISINNTDKEVTTIMKNNENYIRLRDLQDVLDIDYVNGKIIVKSK